MTDRDFRELVRKMRDSQRTYYATREPADLREAKNLERQVDEALEGRPKLFEKKP